MMLPANPPLVSNSKMDNVFSTGTAKFLVQRIGNPFVAIYSYNFFFIMKR
jgi:hypothetical protein